MRIINIWTIFWFLIVATRITPYIHDYLNAHDFNKGINLCLLLSTYGFIGFYSLELLVSRPSIMKFLGWFIVAIFFMHYGIGFHK